MNILLINAYKNRDKIDTLYRFVKKYVGNIILSDTYHIPDSGYDGIIISGSEKLIDRGEYDKPLISFILNNKRPMLGICYGHQIIAYASGGTIRDTGKTLKKNIYVNVENNEKIFEGLPEWIYVAESHQEYVDKNSIGDKFYIIAQSHYTDVEAIKYKTLPVYGLQFHIEKSGKIGEKILKKFITIMQE